MRVYTMPTMRLTGDDGVSNPDRSTQYTNSDPAILRTQVNEAWRQLRLMGRALSDRDEMIGILHGTVGKLNAVNTALHKRLKLTNRIWPLIYAAMGGIAAQIGKMVIEYAIRHLF